MAGRRQIGVDINVDANTRGIDTAATSARAFDEELQRLERTERRQEQAAKRAERATEELAAAQREAAEAAQKLARGEITAAEAAEKAAKAEKLAERQARATAAANLAAARAVDEHAQQQRQLARDAQLAAAAQRLAQLRASGDVQGHDRMIGDLEARFGDLGREGSRAFVRIGSSASDAGAQMAKSGGPYAMAAAIGVAIGALPAIGAVAGLALVSAVGGGLTAIGLKASMSSRRAQDALGRLKDTATTVAKAIGKPWEQTWEAIGDTGVDMLNRVSRPLQEISRGLAPTVSQFIRDLGRSFGELGPFVQSASAAFQRFLRSFADRLPQAMSSLNSSLTMLADAVGDNADEIAALVAGLIQAVGYLGVFLAGLTRIFGALVRTGEAIADVRGTLSAFGQAVGLVSRDTEGLVGSAVGVAAAATAMDAGLGKVAASGSGAAGATNTLKTALQMASQSASALKAELDALTGKELSARETAAAYGTAVLGLNASLKQNGAAHGFATAKGIANEQALTRLVTTAQANSVAMRDNGKSAQQVATYMEAAKKKYIAGAIAAGYSATAAQKQADKLFRVKDAAKSIPKDTKTKVTANTEAANDKLGATKRKAQDVGKQKPKVTVTAVVSQALGALGNVLSKARELAGKVFSFTVRGIIGKAAGGIVPGYAHGGQVQRFPTGGVVRGPGGPTADRVPIMASAGEFVVNAAATRQNLPLLQAINSGNASTATPATRRSGGGGGMGPTVIEIRSGGSRFDDALVEVLRGAIRTRGGNVQVALGR